MENGAETIAQDEIIFRSKYPSVQVPEDLTLPEFVLSNAEPYLDKVAFVDALTGKGYNYGEVTRDIKRFANALRSLGLRKGRVVVVVLPNVAEYAVIALGIMAAGGVFSGANPNAHSSEIKKQVEAADAKLIVTDGSTGICCASIRNKGRVVVMRRYELRAFMSALIIHQIMFAPIVPPIILELVKNPIVDEFDLTKLKLGSVMTAAAPLAHIFDRLLLLN